MFPQAVALFLGTFVSEDLSCVAAGGLVSRGRLSLAAAVFSCAAGIYFGDLALWGAGRLFGSRVLGWPRVRAALPVARLDDFAAWFDNRAAGAILGSRFVPGSRLPLYLAAGASGSSFSSFARWTFVAASIWTPALVIASAVVDDQVASRVGDWLAWGRYGAFGLAVAVLAGSRSGLLVSRRWRQRLTASVSRIWRWEFWPMWVFYVPVGIWTLLLAMRHGGFRTLTAANPGIADGGIVGESKFDILQRLPREWTIPSALIEDVAADQRADRLRVLMDQQGWQLPLVLKPDVGQRGTGVRLVATMEEAREYLRRMTGAVMVQPYHPGPGEAGIFYYRLPAWPTGRILAITDKHFPVVIGDGRSSIEDLVWAHDRYRMQAGTFIARLGPRRHEIPAPGIRVGLGIAGNHAQGTMFTDGFWMCTPELEARVDAIAREYPGFFIGRFDVRYRDREGFMAGRDLAIVELNGATAECTNIYDPAASLFAAYRTLFRQWHLVFAIGAANRRNGRPTSSTDRLFALVRTHFRSSTPFPISD